VNKRFEDIARRKQALIERAAVERAELADAHRQFRAQFSLSGTILWGGTLLGIGRILRTYPVIAAAISSVMVSGYAGKIIKSSGQLLKLWRLVLPLRTWWIKRRRVASRPSLKF
jgi:hypothetical protein